MMQDVVCISSSVQVVDVSQAGSCVMETTTAETTPMNRTVPLPPHHQVHTVAVGVMSVFDGARQSIIRVISSTNQFRHGPIPCVEMTAPATSHVSSWKFRLQIL